MKGRKASSPPLQIENCTTLSGCTTHTDTHTHNVQQNKTKQSSVTIPCTMDITEPAPVGAIRHRLAPTTRPPTDDDKYFLDTAFGNLLLEEILVFLAPDWRMGAAERRFSTSSSSSTALRHVVYALISLLCFLAGLRADALLQQAA